MKDRTSLIYKIPWWLGITYSPSCRLWKDGHGYSWLGRKIRRLHDIDPHALMAAGFEEGRKRVEPAQLQWGKHYQWRTYTYDDGTVETEIYEL